MDPLFEEIEAEETEPIRMVNPVTFVLQFLASYGWYLLGGVSLALYIAHRLRPTYYKWKQAREDAEYHKDKALARMEAIQRARERQQQMIEEASRRALEQQREREERKRAEAAERLEKLVGAGKKLGSGTIGDDYLPLGGAGGGSSYRPPKRSACSRGGCGR